MQVLDAIGTSESDISANLFGANIITTVNSITNESTYTQAAGSLNAGSLRYPGGTVTEQYFDINDPDASSAASVTGPGTVSLIPMSDFFTYASGSGFSVDLVLPTKCFLSEETDEYGNRTAAINEEELSSFVRKVLAGQYGDVNISSFEIGNEYWSGAEMNTFEYANVASAMTEIVANEIALAGSDARILVQMGCDLGTADLSSEFEDCGTPEQQIEAFNDIYDTDFDESIIGSEGNVNWAMIANQIIIDKFTEEGVIEEVDGVVAHIYSKGAEIETSRYYHLFAIENSWGQLDHDVSIDVTEWNQSAKAAGLNANEDYGLSQAREMLNIVEAMGQFDVESAYVWPVDHNTASTLVSSEGGAVLSPGGAMFRLMSENLIGLRMVDYTPANMETEFRADGFEVHSFYTQDRFVSFIVSTGEGGTLDSVDFSGILKDESDVIITKLGVKDGYNPNDSDSPAEIEELEETEYYQDGILDVELDQYEILMISIDNPVYTDEFAEFVEKDRVMADDPPDLDDEDADNSDDDDEDDTPIDDLPYIDPVEYDESSDPVETDEDATGFELAGEAIGGGLLFGVLALLTALMFG